MWEQIGLLLMIAGLFGALYQCVVFVREVVPQTYGGNPGFGCLEMMVMPWLAIGTIGVGLFTMSWGWVAILFVGGFFVFGFLAQLLGHLFKVGQKMNRDDQAQSEGFSASEKAMMMRAVVIGLIASVLTLWLGGVFDADGPAWLTLGVILACLFSFLSAAGVSIMGESVIEDVIKFVMFGAIWLFWRDHEVLGLILLGPTVGTAVAFLTNRLPEKPH